MSRNKPYGGMSVIGNGGRDGGGGGSDPSGGGTIETAALADHGYSNTRDHFTATISSATEITLSSIVDALATIDAKRIVAIGTRPATGEVDWNWIYERGSGYLRISWDNTGKVITVAGVTLDVTHEVAVWIEGPNQFGIIGNDDIYRLAVQLASYMESLQADRKLEINPIDTHGQPDVVADITNGTDGVYPYFLDMATYRKSGLQLELGSGTSTPTVKVFGTMQDDGTAPDACLYQDIGIADFGKASWTTDAMLKDNAEKTSVYKYLKIEVTAAGGGNDADWTIYARRLY